MDPRGDHRDGALTQHQAPALQREWVCYFEAVPICKPESISRQP
jgi:hypothetical protein